MKERKLFKVQSPVALTIDLQSNKYALILSSDTQLCLPSSGLILLLVFSCIQQLNKYSQTSVKQIGTLLCHTLFLYYGQPSFRLKLFVYEVYISKLSNHRNCFLLKYLMSLIYKKSPLISFNRCQCTSF